MTTGQPIGITYIDGVSFGTVSYDNLFAILKDGKTAVIDYAKNIGNYVDENGNERVSGSPDYPLSLSYEIKGGLYSCTLTGFSIDPDAFR